MRANSIALLLLCFRKVLHIEWPIQGDGNINFLLPCCKTANQIFRVVRQRNILHPDVKRAEFFESEDHEMYVPRSLSSNFLNEVDLCTFSNGPISSEEVSGRTVPSIPNQSHPSFRARRL